MSAAACYAGAAQVQDCSTGVLPAGWPPLQVVAIFPPRQPGVVLELARQASRRLARQLVVERFGAEATGLLRGPRATRGARAVSFSHEASISLVAWCPNGTVGIDVVALESLALASQHDLVATAALYLGPGGAALVASAPHAGEARMRFALRWAGLEARLKCLGLALEERQPALDSLLSGTDAVQVLVKDAKGQVSRRWIGCVAWRAGLSPGRPSIGRAASTD